MISLKMGLVMGAIFAAGSIFAPPVQQAIAAVIASDVVCTGCVGTSDLAGNAITAAKIKDGEVKAADIGNGQVTALKIKDGEVGSAEIATDAVTADEIKGVSKLIFAECSFSISATYLPGTGPVIDCSVSGADTDDNVVASHASADCFAITRADTNPSVNGEVDITMVNSCDSNQTPGTGTISIIVYDQ